MSEENIEVQTTHADLKASNIKLMIIGAVLVVITAVVSFAVALYTAQILSPHEAPKGDGYGVVKSDSLGTTFEAGEFITNLNTDSGDRFIKVKIVFAYEDVKVQEEITNKLPQIQHLINSTLRQQSPQSLSEPKAMEKLAELLKKNINSQLIKGNITNLYFTNFVIQ